MIKKAYIQYILPNILLDCIRYVRAIVKKPNFKNIIKLNKEWKNRYKNQKVFVVANGPSLKSIDSNIFAGEKAITMNSFEKCVWKDKVEIVAHCLGEPANSDSWMENSFLDSINGIESHSYWMHFSSKDKLKYTAQKKDKIYYVFPSIESGIYLSKHINLHQSSLSYQTTAQLAIQVAIYMGFSEIVLVGFDHDWLASPDYSKHFYSDKKDEADSLGKMSYIDIIEFMCRMWKIYYKLKYIAVYNAIKIYNITPNSYLDVFEHQEYQENYNIV
jgi:hypothetical protein